MSHPLTTTCRSCGAAICWATTLNGKKIPLDVPGERRVVLEGEPGLELAVVRETFVAHFATCPQATQHRKPKETPTG